MCPVIVRVGPLVLGVYFPQPCPQDAPKAPPPPSTPPFFAAPVLGKPYPALDCGAVKQSGPDCQRTPETGGAAS